MKSPDRHLIRAAQIVPLLAGCLALLWIAPMPAAAQDCGNVSYRLWTQNADAVWYEMGETVEIESGREGHLYLHVESRSASPYSTSAEIGYPERFGFGGRSTDVVRHVKMKAQSTEDRSRGRIRFDAAEPGTTRLGFRLVDVRSPGSLDRVAPRCRTGVVPIRVVPRGGGDDGDGDGDGDGASAAAEKLVHRLYRALLRRDASGRLDPGFVQRVERNAQDGVLYVAETMTASEEFRREALRRTEEAHGRQSLEELRRLLLKDIYRDLYGYAEPDRESREDDLRDLEDCFASRPGNEACRRLGRELVGRRLFYEQNRELIDALSDRRSDGRPGWRGRG